MGEIEETLHAFLGAFSGLRLDEMMVFWSEEADAFFPVEHEVYRLEDKRETAEAFGRVIEKARASGVADLRLKPSDLRVVELGEDAAYATFHIPGDHVSRRTLVLRREREGWRIVHLHASNASAQGGG